MVLLDTTLSISSFGEDETGELYVVNLNGTVSRIVSTVPPCMFGIDPTSSSVAASGGAGTVAVSAGGECAWTAVADATWLQVTAGDSGIGDGSVGYNVDANPLTSGRTGTLIIAGTTFTVTQSGRGPCSFSLVPTSARYPRGGGAGSVTVDTAVGCGWTATSKASWITIVGAANGSGSGTLTYSVAANTSSRKRSGKLVIAGKNFNVTQSR